MVTTAMCGGSFCSRRPVRRVARTGHLSCRRKTGVSCPDARRVRTPPRGWRLRNVARGDPSPGRGDGSVRYRACEVQLVARVATGQSRRGPESPLIADRPARQPETAPSSVSPVVVHSPSQSLTAFSSTPDAVQMHAPPRRGPRMVTRVALAHTLGAILFVSPGPQGVWPLEPRPQVVHRFDPPAAPWAAGHRGVDLAGHVGEQVHAARAGDVVFAGRLAGRGVVVVSHGDTRTTYEPVSAQVAVGDRVRAGDVIGTLELFGSHCFPAACLHWGLIEGREHYLDPLTLVGAGPVRLLPLEPGLLGFTVAPGS